MATPRGAKHTDLEQRLNDLKSQSVRQGTRVLRVTGRSGSVRFHVQQWTVTDLGDQSIPLDYLPVDVSMPGNESLHVRWHPFDLPPDAWSVSGQTLTVVDPDGLFAAGDLMTVWYGYDPTDSTAPPPPPPPGGGTILAFQSSGWKYKQITRTDATSYAAAAYDDSAWPTGAAAFGDGGDLSGSPAHTTLWSKGTRLWTRRTLSGMLAGADMQANILVDRDVSIYLDGTLVHSGSPNGVPVTTTISGAHVTGTSMVLAVVITDESATLGCYFDLELIQ